MNRIVEVFATILTVVMTLGLGSLIALAGLVALVRDGKTYESLKAFGLSAFLFFCYYISQQIKDIEVTDEDLIKHRNWLLVIGMIAFAFGFVSLIFMYWDWAIVGLVPGLLLVWMWADAFVKYHGLDKTPEQQFRELQERKAQKESDPLNIKHLLKKK